VRVRHLVSTRSFDLDTPGAQPWVTNSTLSKYELTPQNQYPVGQPTQPMVTPQPAQINNVPVPPNDYSDFKTGDGRANLLSRVDLARKLTPYVDITGKFVPPMLIDTSTTPPTATPIPPPTAVDLYTRFPLANFPQYRYYFALYDRQQFAMDIFERLVHATGAASMARIRALPPEPPATPQEYAAVRYLAQLAVNIVDYIDEDDVITPFPWNALGTGAFPWNAPLTDQSAKTFEQSSPTPSQSPGWVYGTEAPKVVINEAYCELQNHPQDRTSSQAQRPFQFSFWVELLNPTPAAAGGGPSPPDRADPDKISFRNQAPHDRMAAQLERASVNGFFYPVYQVVIVDDKVQIETQVKRNRDNNEGWIDEGRQRQFVKIQATSFTNGGQPSPPDPRDPFGGYFDANFVEPSAGDFDTQGRATPLPRNQGFYVLAPDQPRDFQPEPNVPIDFTPTLRMRSGRPTDEQPMPPPAGGPLPPSAPVWGQVRGGTAQNGMSYETPAGIKTTEQFAAEKQNFMGGRRHTVLLRRLACPGLDPNPLILDPGNPRYGQPFHLTKPYNPYITVDYLTDVPTNDAVKLLPGDQASANLPKNNPNYFRPHERRSMARRQPYAAIADISVQAPSARPVSATFFKHNNQTEPQIGSVARIDVPFDWLVHLDRAPATVTELLNVSAVAPHLLTQQFIIPKYDQEVNPLLPSNLVSRQLQAETKFQHLAPWTDQNARLFRALEFFTVGDRSPYPGTLGRVAGKMNLNSWSDRLLVEAAADLREKPTSLTQPVVGQPVPRTANFAFQNPAAPINAVNVPNLGAVTDSWQGNGIVTDPTNVSFRNRKQRLFGVGLNPDRPFTSFAVPVIQPGTDPNYPTGAGIADTILPFPDPTQDPATNKGLIGTFTPLKLITSPPQNPPVWPSTDYTAVPSPQLQVKPEIPPYILNEVLTKVTGHVTPRSNTFAVFLTVGFFEVVDPTTSPVKLGAEITDASGKYVRHQMFSIVDRTNLAIDGASSAGAGGTLRQAPTPPVFMSIADTIPAGAGAASPPTQPFPSPVVVNVAGGIPENYDATTPVTIPGQPILPHPPNQPYPINANGWPPGTYQWMYLDMGDRQERVQVTVSPSRTQLWLWFPPVPGVPTDLGGAKFTHPPGTMLCTYQPGNPGPQGPINYASPQYKAVVPFAYIVQ
jgi:hypothetical protein